MVETKNPSKRALPVPTKPQRPAAKRHLSPRGKKVIGVVSLGVLVVLTGVLFWFVGQPLMQYISQPDGFRVWVDAHGILGRLAFVGLMALQVVVAIIPGEPLEIFAGYAFGAVEGTILCMVGALVGSIAVFALVRTFGVKIVEAFFSMEKIHSMKFLQNSRRLNLLTFIVYLIPGTPKDLLAYVVGLTPMKLSTWILITATARIPSVITSTIGGDALGTQNYTFAIWVFAATLVISGVGLLVYRRMARRDKENEKTPEQ